MARVYSWKTLLMLLYRRNIAKALGECDLEIVSQPEINVTQMEPGKALIFTADVAVKPEVTLGEYKGVEVPKSEISCNRRGS